MQNRSPVDFQNRWLIASEGVGLFVTYWQCFHDVWGMEKEISTIPSILRTETFVNLHVFKGRVVGLDTGIL